MFCNYESITFFYVLIFAIYFHRLIGSDGSRDIWERLCLDRCHCSACKLRPQSLPVYFVCYNSSSCEYNINT